MMDQNKRVVNDNSMPSIKQNTIFTDKFNKDLFNKTFEEEEKVENKEIIEYQEPEALPSSGNMNYRELGKNHINDFGSNDNSELQYTDYNIAYQKSKFDPNKVKYRQYNNINELKNERDNISYQISKEDEEHYQMKKQQEQLAEEHRRRRIQEDDDRYIKQYNQLNKLLIKN